MSENHWKNLEELNKLPYKANACKETQSQILGKCSWLEHDITHFLTKAENVKLDLNGKTYSIMFKTVAQLLDFISTVEADFKVLKDKVTQSKNKSQKVLKEYPFQKSYDESFAILSNTSSELDMRLNEVNSLLNKLDDARMVLVQLTSYNYVYGDS